MKATCTRCGETKDQESGFYKRGGLRVDGTRSWRNVCKACTITENVKRESDKAKARRAAKGGQS